MNLAGSQERTAIQDFLSRNKISPTEKLSRCEGDAKKIHCGKVSFSVLGGDKFKMANGFIIDMSKYSSFDAAFAETFQMVAAKKTAGLYQLFFPLAYAGVGAEIFDAVSAAAYFATNHAIRATSTGLIVFPGT